MAGYYRIGFLMVCLLGMLISAVAQLATPDLQVTFGENGLVSIKHGAIELLDASMLAPSMQWVRFPTPDGKFEQLYEPKVTKQSFDAQKKVLTQIYEWGTVQIIYVLSGYRLNYTVTVTNTTQKSLGTFNLFPIKFLLPRTRQNLQGGTFVDGYGVVTVLDWDFGGGATYGIWPYETPKEGKQLIPLSMGLPNASIATHPIVDNAKYFNYSGRPIAAGKSASYHFSLVFGKPGSSISELVPEYYQAYSQAKPMLLKWPDRRPIGTIFYAHPNMGWKTNPRGFNFGKGAENDITTPEGLKAFALALQQYGDACLTNLKALQAQGVIVWDLEGEEFWHPLSYLGDPRMLPQVAPEMDRLEDAFLKKFTDAGLRVGMTIRPTEVFYREGQTPRFWQRDVKDPVEVMSAKIAYAKKRWGATIFYLDSNVFGSGFDTVIPAGSNVPWVMPVSMIQQLQARYPDCLIIPEWSEFDYYRFSAPYSSPNLRQFGTDGNTRQIYPKAFRIVAVNSDLIESNWQDYLWATQGGDILLFPCWFAASENDLVKLLYREGAIRQQGMPAILKKATAQTLLAQAASPDEATRYYVASLLGNETDIASQALLIKLLDDTSPLVRKSALVALAQRKGLTDTALIERLAKWIEQPADAVNGALRAFVADVLGHMGEAAVPRLLTMLQGGQSQVVAYAYRALGATGTSNAQAIALLLQTVEKPVGADQNQEIAIKVLGDLKATSAIPALLTVLKDNVRDHEFIRQQAVIALGKIGDRSAIDALVNEYNKTYSTVVVYSIEQSIDDALYAITGEKNLVGKGDWQRWWGQHREEK